LSVFAGGFDLATVEEVCAGDEVARSDTLDLVTRLVDKSLVVVERPPGEIRYRLLETIRQYSAEQLAASADCDRYRRRHAESFMTLAETAEPGLKSRQQERWLSRLEREHDNLRAALDWGLAPVGDLTIGLRLAAALAWRSTRTSTGSRSWSWPGAAPRCSATSPPATSC
jgi:non-specific serine/threonine protein kinase